MNRAGKVALLAVFALLAGGLGVFLGNRQPGSAAESVPHNGSALLALRLPDASGRVFAMSDWQGKVIVANFWATWCPPCLREIPAFDRASRRYSKDGVQFVGISIDTADNVRQFAAREKIGYPLLIADTGVLGITSALGNRMQALPFTAIVDRAGVLRRVKLGVLSEAELDETLARLR
ncbi:MAG: TlpA disulfide reductase family protein [Rhodocyclaceae bacterium]